MRLATFIIALLLLAGSVDPERGWLIALVVVSGLAAMRWRPWRPLRLRPTIDLRLATFTLAVLLLAGVIDPTRGWLIATTVIAGLAMLRPGMHWHPNHISVSAGVMGNGWHAGQVDHGMLEHQLDHVWRGLHVAHIFHGPRSFRREWRAWDARWGDDWDGEDLR